MPDGTLYKTEDCILEALRQLLLNGAGAKRYRDIAVNKIAGKAGFSRQAFYRHFPGGKDDIVRYFMEQAVCITVVKEGVSPILAIDCNCGLIDKNSAFLKALFADEYAYGCLLRIAHKKHDEIITEMKDRFPPENRMLYSYRAATRLMSEFIVFFEWLHYGMPVPFTDLAASRDNRRQEPFSDMLPVAVRFREENTAFPAITRQPAVLKRLAHTPRQNSA